MAENNLVITLSLDDKASKDVADALKKIGVASKQTSDQINKDSGNAEKGTKKHTSALLEARTAVQGFRREMFIMGAVVATAGFSLSEYAQRNIQTRDSLREVQAGMKNMIALIGGAFAPILVGLAESFKGSFDFIKESFRNLQIAFAAMIDGFVYGFTFWKNIARGIPAAMREAQKASEELSKKLSATFVENIPSLETAKNKLKDLADIVTSLKTRYEAGEISATDFYKGISDKAQQTVEINRFAETQLMQLAQAQMQVSSEEILMAQRVTRERISSLEEYKTNYMVAHAGMAAFTTSISSSIRTNLSNAFSDVILGIKTAKDAFSEFGKLLIKTVVDFMAQKLVAFALEKTLLAGTVAAGVAAGAATAAAWAPAAAMVSLATFGANAAPASAAIASTTALATALSLPKLAEGTDTVPAMLSPGEMVFPRSMADAIRAGDISVGGRNGSSGGGDIQINLYGVTINSKENIRELAEELGFEIDRKFNNARSII